ncbi:hypothetical protein WR25_24705 [Diploscapter pachys]|uniref:C2H2-type domain-containing protein n=1 Tax=Diploscapter pachys TaxID=2018661 RepID=A0A2A2L9D5_9BILA|nr:hypothetical protein WR25_24705 [Diploscapter pachys]
MLLDDLSKHPALAGKRLRSSECSTSSQPSETPPNLEESISISSERNSSISFRDIVLATAKTINVSPRPDSRQSSYGSSSNVGAGSSKEPDCLETNGSELLDLIKYQAQEIINVGGKDETDGSNDTFADNEDMSFTFDPQYLLAQARCIVGDASSSTPPLKRMKIEDPEKDYHQCQLCGTRVKAPRGGRWNLQMHVLAMHSTQRPYKCQQCEFQDYRKPGMRKHCIISHGEDMEPVDISTEDKRREWDAIMGRCFPEFAYRTGFLVSTLCGSANTSVLS